MEKIFTVTAISRYLESPTSNLIEWSLVDEKNQTRVVKGQAELTVRGFIREVKPFNPREMPLVEALTHHGEGETFGLDFALFNKTFGYGQRVTYPRQFTQPETRVVVANNHAKGFAARLKALFQPKAKA